MTETKAETKVPKPKLTRYTLKSGNCETYIIQITNLSPDIGHITSEEFEELWKLRPADRGYIQIGAKAVPLPRWQKIYGMPYYFSRQAHRAAKVKNPTMARIQKIVTEIQKMPYENFIVNWYDGPEGSYMGAHADDTRQLVKGTDIYSYNYTSDKTERGDWTFRVRDKATGEIVLDLKMPNNSLVIMSYAMQEYFTHEVPKLKTNTSRRVNLTLRALDKAVTERLCAGVMEPSED